jgi:hypothetical membrane protein
LALARLSYQHHRHHHHKNHHFYFIITLIITFITILTILLSARHMHEIGILALQVDESIVMKLMMSSGKRNAGVIERIGAAASTIIGSPLHRSGIQIAQERRHNKYDGVFG